MSSNNRPAWQPTPVNHQVPYGTCPHNDGLDGMR